MNVKLTESCVGLDNHCLTLGSHTIELKGFPSNGGLNHDEKYDIILNKVIQFVKNYEDIDTFKNRLCILRSNLYEKRKIEENYGNQINAGSVTLGDNIDLFLGRVAYLLLQDKTLKDDDATIQSFISDFGKAFLDIGELMAQVAWYKHSLKNNNNTESKKFLTGINKLLNKNKALGIVILAFYQDNELYDLLFGEFYDIFSDGENNLCDVLKGLGNIATWTPDQFINAAKQILPYYTRIKYNDYGEVDDQNKNCTGLYNKINNPASIHIRNPEPKYSKKQYIESYLRHAGKASQLFRGSIIASGAQFFSNPLFNLLPSDIDIAISYKLSNTKYFEFLNELSESGKISNLRFFSIDSELCEEAASVSDESPILLEKPSTFKELNPNDIGNLNLHASKGNLKFSCTLSCESNLPPYTLEAFFEGPGRGLTQKGSIPRENGIVSIHGNVINYVDGQSSLDIEMIAFLFENDVNEIYHCVSCEQMKMEDSKRLYIMFLYFNSFLGGEKDDPKKIIDVLRNIEEKFEKFGAGYTDSLYVLEARRKVIDAINWISIIATDFENHLSNKKRKNINEEKEPSSDLPEFSIFFQEIKQITKNISAIFIYLHYNSALDTGTLNNKGKEAANIYKRIKELKSQVGESDFAYFYALDILLYRYKEPLTQLFKDSKQNMMMTMF